MEPVLHNLSTTADNSWMVAKPLPVSSWITALTGHGTGT
jgi:hypothetical protein